MEYSTDLEDRKKCVNGTRNKGGSKKMTINFPSLGTTDFIDSPKINVSDLRKINDSNSNCV
jgi:hypothetical protein